MTLAWIAPEFHFLRPWALYGLLPLLPLAWLARRKHAVRPLAVWRDRIDAHLLAALTVPGDGDAGLRPVHTLLLAIALGCIGLAGPAWERETTPLVEDRAPLVIALDLSPSMDAVDVTPTRLERAKLKLRTLLERRKGARTALIVFGATAHRVLPLTEDPQILLAYVPDLTTGLLPATAADGTKALGAALALTARTLAHEATPGSMLLLTDGFTPADAHAIITWHRQGRTEPLLLAFGTGEAAPLRAADGSYVTGADGRRLMAEPDREGLQAATAAGVWLASATTDDRDLVAIEARIERHLHDALAADPGTRWRDQGLWLALPAAALLLLSFRPGWTVRWSDAAGMLLVMLLGAGATGDAQAGATTWHKDFRMADLWASREQQGRWYFEQGRFDEAASVFTDPLWRGIALYRAGRFAAAADILAGVDTAEAHYNLGNALARLQRYPEAVKAYDEALANRPAWTEAQANRALVAALLPPDEADDERDMDEAADVDDESVPGRKRRQGKTRQMLGEEEVMQLWLARIQTSPAGFLRRRFALEAAEIQAMDPDRKP